MKILLPIALLTLLLSCTKEARTENWLKKGSGKWNIIYSEWHLVSFIEGVTVDTSGLELMPGYFEFGKKQQGSWLCDADSILGYNMGFGSSFAWHADDKTVYTNSHTTEPADLSEHPLFFATWTSFTGTFHEDKSGLTLEGYYRRQFAAGDYIHFFALFFLEKEQ